MRTLGHEKCKPNHSYTYAYTDFYIIHYVVKGCGKVYFEGECYPVKKGEIFIIKPGGVYNYIADENDPWEYYWVGFNGTYAQKAVANLPFKEKMLVPSSWQNQTEKGYEAPQ